MEQSYRTVAGRGQARFHIRGSEFIGTIAPTPDPESAETFIERVSAEYDDATHNVPAYRVHAPDGPLREWADDAGEPGGSAGKPALNVLVQEDIQNVAVVVTRYYGGTKLGVGGLARAYARGVKEALTDAGIVEQEPQERFAVTVAYDDSGTVRGILESAETTFEATYEETVTFEVRAPTANAGDIRDRIKSATSGRAQVE